MYKAEQFKVGDWFTCDYNGKRRICEVVDVKYDYLVVNTQDGFRSLKFKRIEKVCDASIS